MASARSTRTLSPRRSSVLLVALLRLLGVLMAAELSGAAHALVDASAMLGGAEHPEDDCDAEEGHECPPGCPNCHCTHGGLAVGHAPRIEVRLTVLPPARRAAGFVPVRALPPASAELSRLYRPPRPLA